MPGRCCPLNQRLAPGPSAITAWTPLGSRLWRRCKLRPMSWRSRRPCSWPAGVGQESSCVPPSPLAPGGMFRANTPRDRPGTLRRRERDPAPGSTAAARVRMHSAVRNRPARGGRAFAGPFRARTPSAATAGRGGARRGGERHLPAAAQHRRQGPQAGPDYSPRPAPNAISQLLGGHPCVVGLRWSAGGPGSPRRRGRNPLVGGKLLGAISPLGGL